MSEAPRANTCRACCPSCGLHFAGTEAFDRHLGGEANEWAHHHPLDVLDRRGEQRFDRERGECRMIPGERDQGWIWYLVADRARARTAFDRGPALGRKGVAPEVPSPLGAGETSDRPVSGFQGHVAR